MKVLMMFVASAVSATLVLPTVTQAQSGTVRATVVAAADAATSAVRQG
jgi:hypothetical protein